MNDNECIGKCLDCKFCNRESFEEELYCEIYETFVEPEETICADFEWREEYVED